MVKLIAAREATHKAIQLGFRKLIMLVGDKDIVRIWSNKHHTRGQLTPILEDLNVLQQQYGLYLHIRSAHPIILADMNAMARKSSNLFVNVYQVTTYLSL